MKNTFAEIASKGTDRKSYLLSVTQGMLGMPYKISLYVKVKEVSDELHLKWRTQDFLMMESVRAILVILRDDKKERTTEVLDAIDRYVHPLNDLTHRLLLDPNANFSDFVEKLTELNATVNLQE